jgi:hypothetical protein
MGWMTVVQLHAGAGIFALATTLSRTATRHLQSLVQWVFQVKRLACDGDHVSSCGEVRNIFSIPVLCHMSSGGILG